MKLTYNERNQMLYNVDYNPSSFYFFIYFKLQTLPFLPTLQSLLFPMTINPVRLRMTNISFKYNTAVSAGRGNNSRLRLRA